MEKIKYYSDKEYERKMALNSLYGVRINKTVPEPKRVYVTTASITSTPYEDFMKERIKEKEMNNNIEWIVKNVKLNREFDPGSHDHFDVELEGIIRGPVAGNIIDIGNRLQEKLNEPVGYTTVRFMSKRPSTTKLPEIKKVIFNNPATIVIWTDDTKTIVKAQNDEHFDDEKGLAMAITKKALGNEGNYYDIIKKYIYPDTKQKEEEHSKQWLAYQRLCNAFGDKKATKKDLLIAMEEAIGYLGEVLE